ncbi:hypothetical protein [Nocardioides sp. cx-173]|uniref:hypothetical protein n=1 Tax=Nocardioides sp. cx-173 TaxID=2898796 RepID=UPI001E36233E|nr:hypothetical protein [Nocardioides sp. cx-173]MCD4523456.1 hypothetical protein [Nocardioides sp. cx-173]UGB42205.1 hypothetical protein LQ940_01435 [Nocardioides sp. cx-173]
MSGSGAGSAGGATDAVALTVLGPSGALDLLVPAGASAHDVAVEYAAQAGVDALPTIYTRVGRPLAPDAALESAGIGAGALVVALPYGAAPPAVAGRRGRADSRPARRVEEPGSLSVLWFCVSAAAALLAGWFASQQEPSDLRTATVALLGGAALLGVLPVGRYAAHRILAAPAFAASAAFVVAWDPAPERLPTILGVAALSAAVTAAVARSLDRYSEEALRVWVVVGVAVFVVTCAVALLDFRPQVAWALLLVAAMLAARFVPTLAVDVPDQFLIDLERLAVTAWSARDRPTGRRGRIVVPPRAVEIVAARGTRIITASSVAILAVVVVAAPLLLETATQRPDWIGARCVVGFAGGSLLFVARSYRHAAARALLRAAGLVCWAALLVVLFRGMEPGSLMAVGIAATAVAALLLLVAVALGRGWRSAWWSRKAEVAEAICGSFAVGALVPAVGLFRHLWELTG